MIVNFTESCGIFAPGIKELAQLLQIEAVFGGRGDVEVAAQQGAEDLLSLSLRDGRATVTYGRPVHFFRALGILCGKLRAGEGSAELSERMVFTTNGPMIDVSQNNAVPTVPSVKRLLRMMSLMGLNALMLYSEDSYAVPEEPYFGYMRGKYTEAELRELDDYADSLGIEMIPCIQTLAHLTDALRWKVYDGIRENNDCLLVGEEKTYEFIKHMIEAAARPFRTKRIHIGMDEAWDLGRGAYMTKHGYTPKAELMTRHLRRVCDIVRSLGLSPMIWSDMFFRALDPDGRYYLPDISIPEDFAKSVPEGVRLVYWDYYHRDEDFYCRFIEKHRAFGEPVFAGGIHSWVSFGVNWYKTFDTSRPALDACKKAGVREVFATVWGDNGAECNLFANLPGFQFFAEHGYGEDPSDEWIAERFKTCTGGDYDDFMLFSAVDKVASLPLHCTEAYNCSKYLLWQDILCGLFDASVAELDVDGHYAKLVPLFSEAAEKEGFAPMMAVYRDLCSALAIKGTAGRKLTAAYRAGDRAALAEIRDSLLPELIRRVRRLRQSHKKLWFETYQHFGWEVMDMRYGSLLIRAESAVEQIGAYLNGDADALSELSEPRLPYNGEEKVPHYVNYYGEIVSASRIAPKA